MTKTKKASTSQEVESIEKKHEMVKPLKTLCKAYEYNLIDAFDAAFVGRLRLPRIDNELYCATKRFRTFLQEEYVAGRYTKSKICTKCGHLHPLWKFSLDNENLYPWCCECRAEKDKKALLDKKKRAYGEAFDDEENQHSDCRVYKSIDEFVGKPFIIETKSEGDVIDFLSMTIESVLMDDDGRSAVLAGKDKDGKTRIQKLLIAEVQSLCYEGLSIYWSEKSEKLYKKVLILNNN